MATAAKKNKETAAGESCEQSCAPDSDAKIAELAYLKAASRDFEPGHELDDWLEAEREVMQCECD